MLGAASLEGQTERGQSRNKLTCASQFRIPSEFHGEDANERALGFKGLRLRPIGLRADTAMEPQAMSSCDTCGR